MRKGDEAPNAFPQELRMGITALADQTRERILLALAIRDCSYTELQKALKIRKGSLTHHLKRLMKAGLVRNYSKGRLARPFDSFYTTTSFGKDLLEAIMKSFQPIELVPTKSLTQVLSSARELGKAPYFVSPLAVQLTSP
jgi:DNA-binding transcriptional ArsR family regulator